MLLWLALVPLAFWLLLSADRRRRWPAAGLPAPGPRAAGPRGGEDVVAVVPARNEADSLPRTLPALLDQDHEPFRVILVDDRSNDGTAEVARRIAADCARAERLEVVAATAPPSGWSGKVHALAAGVAAADAGRPGPPAWLLFTDADILHRRESVRALLEKARDGRDLVSVMARLHAEGPWERLLVPPFVFFFQLLYPFRLVARQDSRVAAAAGGCVLVRRRTLEAAGGLEAIRGALIDDVALAAAVKRAGGRLWLGLDGGVCSVREYRGLGELWRMVSRCAFEQLRRSWLLLAAVLAALAVLFVAPPLIAAAAAGLLLAGTQTTAAAGALAAAAACWALETAALLPAVRHHGMPRAYAATLPLAAALYGLMTVSSAWNHLRGTGVEWRGRRYGGE